MFMVQENAQLTELMSSDLQLYEDTDFIWTPKNTLRIHVTSIPDLQASKRDTDGVLKVMQSLVTFFGGTADDAQTIVYEKGTFVEVSGKKAADVARIVRFAFPDMIGAANIPGGRSIL